MSDDTQYDDGGSAFDALETEEYGDLDLGFADDAASEHEDSADPEEVEQAVAATIAEFPELANHEVVAELAEHVQRAAEELGQPDLVQDLGFIRAVHVARGAGAAAAPQGDEFDQALALNGKGRSALPF